MIKGVSAFINGGRAIILTTTGAGRIQLAALLSSL